MFAQADAPVFNPPHIGFWALTPILVLLGGALVLLCAAAISRSTWFRSGYAVLTSLVFVGAGACSVVQWHQQADGPLAPAGVALSLDGFAVFFTILVCAAGVLTSLFTDDYLRREGLETIESYALILLASVGAIIMAMATDMLVLFLGLEILSITLYVMAASHARRIESQESAVKYFVLGGFSSAFLLYGIALVYGATGSTHFGAIRAFLDANTLLNRGLLMAGFALLLVGLGFKIGAAPFHQWTPDVYQGAPSPVSGFMASAAKAAAFAAMLRVFTVVFQRYEADWRPAVLGLVVLTLIVGAFSAIVQTDVKRMLAYSSIGHAGFILIGLHANSNKGIAGSLVYLFAYAIMVLGSFGCVTLIGRTGDADHSLATYRGLSRERPVLAVLFAIFLLAQAGMPLTSGFIAKLGVLQAAAERNSYGLAVAAMLAGAVSAYVYLRIVVSMFLADAETGDDARERVRIPVLAGIGLVAAAAFTLLAGIIPGWLVDFAQHAVPVLPK